MSNSTHTRARNKRTKKISIENTIANSYKIATKNTVEENLLSFTRQHTVASHTKHFTIDHSPSFPYCACCTTDTYING